MKRFQSTGRWVLCLAVAALIPLACGDDDPVVPNDPGSGVKDLTRKSDVLSNIEYAYSHDKSNGIAVYDDLLDATNFTFIYTEPDGGGGTPVQWGRADEVAVTTGLFQAADRIDLDLIWQGDLTWVASAHGDETWYTTNVYYDFAIEIGLTTYLNPGAQVEFTVRNAGTDEAPRWQLVEFRDLAETFSTLAASKLTTETATWGRVKALYR